MPGCGAACPRADRDQRAPDGVGLVLGGLAVMGLYTVFRKTGRSWWIWGAVVVEIVAVVAIVIGPVFIEPAFNEYSSRRR